MGRSTIFGSSEERSLIRVFEHTNRTDYSHSLLFLIQQMFDLVP